MSTGTKRWSTTMCTCMTNIIGTRTFPPTHQLRTRFLTLTGIDTNRSCTHTLIIRTSTTATITVDRGSLACHAQWRTFACH
jgi:hypothetical protein